MKRYEEARGSTLFSFVQAVAVNRLGATEVDLVIICPNVNTWDALTITIVKTDV